MDTSPFLYLISEVLELTLLDKHNNKCKRFISYVTGMFIMIHYVCIMEHHTDVRIMSHCCWFLVRDLCKKQALAYSRRDAICENHLQRR